MNIRGFGSPLVLGLWLLGCNAQSARVQTSVGSSREATPLMTVGMRRLTNREFVRLAQSLLQVSLPAAFEAGLPPDVRQEDGYTRNREQTMSPALAVKLADALPSLVTEALKQTGSTVFTCEQKSGACVKRFLEDTFRRAYRRESQAAELEELERVFEAAAAPGTAKDGAIAVLCVVLQSPRLWYVTEIGEPAERASVVRLARYEVADQLSFTMRGEAADPLLLADVDQMYDPDVRMTHARRLLSDANARQHYREFVLQWLEVDELARTAKSSSVFEQYESFKPRMLDETVNFADEVFVHEGASIGSLLTAGFVSVDPHMAVLYGLQQYGARVDATNQGRVGVLQHASFLSAHSHADTTSPVLRGDFVLRKVLCERLPRPSELDIEVIMPRPSQELTRREQFAFHGADPKCAQCHDQIDGFGLTLERFDAAGKEQELELGKPVRTDGAVFYRGQRVSFATSVELSRWLAQRPEAVDCFARHAFRFVTGQRDAKAEDAFVALRYDLPQSARTNLLEHLVAYVGTDAFIHRRVR